MRLEKIIKNNNNNNYKYLEHIYNSEYSKLFYYHIMHVENIMEIVCHINDNTVTYNNIKI
jgi:hypothetical protein